MAKKRKKDWAEKETDDLLDELEKRIVKEYTDAFEHAKQKYEEFSKRFKDKDKQMREKLNNGEITDKEYTQWKATTLIAGNRWKQLADTLAEDLTKVDQKVVSITNGYMPEAYAKNFNYTTYDIEKNVQIDTSFSLYSRETVEKLFRENPDLLPNRKVDVPKDLKWNKQHITSAVMQGILSGDDIPSIGDRLQQVTDMDRRAAIRNARTMMTGAQNGGRMDAYERAATLGINIKKQWLATLDSRTRDSHQDVDGEIVGLKDKFSNGLMYPGDSNGAAEEVYNCRCTMIPYYPDYADEGLIRYDQENKKYIEYKTYNEWVQKHSVKESVKKKEIVKVKNEITEQAARWGIAYNEPKPMSKSEEEIIRDVGGGDLTKGSCVSLSLCYAGNKAGYEVLDFRGGDSEYFFSKIGTLHKISQFDGVKSFIAKETNDFKAVQELIKNVVENKEYILSVGQHATIIKKNEGKYQYLELQTMASNGFINFAPNTLKNRFGCKRSHTIYGEKVAKENLLIEVDSLVESNDFKAILGYINTSESEQKKGIGGYAK